MQWNLLRDISRNSMCTEWISNVSETVCAPIIRYWYLHSYLMVEAESLGNVGDSFHIDAAARPLRRHRNDDKIFAFLVSFRLCLQGQKTDYRNPRVGETCCHVCRQEQHGCRKQFSSLRNNPVLCFQVGPLSAHRQQCWNCWNNSCLALYRRVSYKCKDKGKSLGSSYNLLEGDVWLDHCNY
jgi:hypothetical protein